MYREPLAYFLTFSTFGAWLPGDDRGFTQDEQNARGTKKRGAAPRLYEKATESMRGPSRILSGDERHSVDAIIRESCAFRSWRVLALNVRSNHVHLVVAASEEKPEAVMRKLKARVTRVLREQGVLGTDERLWSRHGSTVYLFSNEKVDRASWYTLEAQDGERFELAD